MHGTIIPLHFTLTENKSEIKYYLFSTLSIVLGFPTFMLKAIRLL